MFPAAALLAGGAGGGGGAGFTGAAGDALKSIQSSSEAKSGSRGESSSYGSFGDFNVNTNRGGGGIPTWLIAAGIGAVVLVVVLMARKG